MGLLRSIFILVLAAIAFGLPQLLQFRVMAAVKYFLVEVVLFGAIFGGVLTGGIMSVIAVVAWFVMWLRVYRDAKFYRKF